MKQIKTKTRNKKYRKTEDAILEVLMKSKELPSAKSLVRRAHISRSTLYRHHKTVPGIILDYEKEVLAKFGNVVRRLIRHKNTQIRKICLRALLFILAEKRAFRILLKYDGGTIIERMVMKLKKQIKERLLFTIKPR